MSSLPADKPPQHATVREWLGWILRESQKKLRAIIVVVIALLALLFHLLAYASKALNMNSVVTGSFLVMECVAVVCDAIWICVLMVSETIQAIKEMMTGKGTLF